MEILQWKFHYYDVNNNDILSSQELYHFRTDLVKLIRCESFFDSLIEEIMDDDEELNIQTWGNFFDGKYYYLDIGSPIASYLTQYR